MDTKGKIKAFVGTHNMGTFNLGNAASGARVLGDATGMIAGYDYRDLFNLYGIGLDEPSPTWITAFQKDKDQIELKKLFERLQPINKLHTLNFWVQGNDTNIQNLNIHYGVIRLQYGMEIKDFVILNNISSSAATVPTPGVIVMPYGGFFPFTDSNVVGAKTLIY